MTTSFANFTRGRVVESIRANSAGFLLALVCAAQIPWSWTSVYRGRLLWVDDPERAALWGLGGLFVVCLIEWSIRISLF